MPLRPRSVFLSDPPTPLPLDHMNIFQATAAVIIYPTYKDFTCRNKKSTFKHRLLQF